MRALRTFFAFHVALTILLCSCAGTTGARKTLATVGEFANDARDLLESFDKHYQDSILVQLEAGDVDRDTATKQVKAYRDARARVALGISELQALVAAGKPLVQLMEDGKKSNVDWATYERNLLDLLDNVRNALTTLGVKVP